MKFADLRIGESFSLVNHPCGNKIFTKIDENTGEDTVGNKIIIDGSHFGSQIHYLININDEVVRNT